MRKRRHDRGEAIHARLEAQLRENLDDPRARRAYGESLRAQGDPLGELMLVALEAEAFDDERRWERVGTLIRKNWGEWFGDLDARNVRFEWLHGLVRRAWLGRHTFTRSLALILGTPPMRFVESVDASDFEGRLSGLDDLPCLRELAVPVTGALQCRSNLARFGQGLTLKGSVRELRLWSKQLRRSFPGVKLRPRLPKAEVDGMFTGPEATAEPMLAGRGPSECARTTEDPRPYRYCAACTSEETTLLHVQTDWMEFRQCVTYEYVCRECEQFTHYTHLTWQPEFPKRPRARRQQKTQPELKLAS
jgi:hypothetical protein